MPKLENFATHIKVDGNPFAKNAINYQVINGDGVGLYYSMDRDRRILERLLGRFSDWTNHLNVPYASFADLIADLDLFLFGQSDSVVLQTSLNQLQGINKGIDNTVIQQRITNRILSEVFDHPLFTEQDLNI